MSKDFFSLIADQLCSFKNTPFRRLDKHGNPNIDPNNQSNYITKSKRLSYNPDRLFDPQKDKKNNQKINNNHKQYEEFIKQQKQNLQKIQITLLQQKTHQELKKLQQKTYDTINKNFQYPFTFFKVYRSVCKTCNKCFQYNGNYNMGCQIYSQTINQPIQYLCCLTCGCPMNSHVAISQNNKFRTQIFNHLSSNLIEVEHLNFKYFPICFLKKSNIKLNKLMDNFYNYLPQLGFNILSYKVLSKNKFQTFLIKKQILMFKENQNVEKLISFLSFLENQENWINQQNLPEELDRLQFEIIKRIKNQINIDKYLKQIDQVIVFYVTNINNFQNNQLQSILKYYQNYFESQYLWSPKIYKEKFLTSCILFPEHFTLNHQIFVLPSQKTISQAEKTSYRFKDLLDYNNYISIGLIKQIQKEKLQSILKFQNFNKINYILGDQQLNQKIKKARIQLTAKIGPSIFTIPFKNAVDFIQISSKEKKSPFMLAFPDYLKSQRCFIILRPCFSFSNLQQTLICLLRINNFILLKRRSLIFSEQQAKYLATLQKIHPNNIDSYVKMMTSGMSQIVLVSKRGAIYQADILLNGSKVGYTQTKTKTLKGLHTLNIKRGVQNYEYTPIINSLQNQSLQCFKSFQELFKIQNVLFPNFQRVQIKCVTNVRNGQLVKIDSQQKAIKQLKVSSKMKENLLNEIKKDPFNYWLMTSKSQILTEELAGLFFPETTLFQSCVVIVKPSYLHLVNKIKQSLFQHRYHVIFQKTVLLSKALAVEMIKNLSKIKMNSDQLKKISQVYYNQKIHIFCISKIYGKQQMFSFLSKFNFLPKKSIIVDDYIDDDNLKQVLIPVWNSQQLVLKIISSPLYNIQEAILSLQRPGIYNQDKFEILKYLVGSYYGINIDDLALNTILGKLSYYITQPDIAYLQSWFYSQLSKQNARYVPILFQYRNIGQTCFVIQTDEGFPFLNLILKQYEQQKQKLQQIYNKQQRNSLILFLWGKKLVQFTQRVCSQKANIKGWGQMKKIADQWRGILDQKQIMKIQRKFLSKVKDLISQFIQKYHHNRKKQKQQESFRQKGRQSFKQKQSNRQKNIQFAQKILLNVQKLLNSRFLNEKYNVKNDKKTFIPNLCRQNIDQNIRIIQSQQTSKLSLMDKYSMIDPDHQKHNDKSLYTLNLFKIQPIIGTKQQCIVEIIIFLMEYQKNNKNHSFMFSKLLQSFIQNIVDHSQIDVIQSELYIKLLKYTFSNIYRGIKQNWSDENFELPDKQNWFDQNIINYPNLRKFTINQTNDDVSGKKRRFLEKKQYYIDKNSNLNEKQMYLMKKQYLNFNLNYQILEEYNQKRYDKQNPLLNMQDPMHRNFALQERTISLLRQNQQTLQKPGIYVEFEKKISENQQLLMNKINGQVDKFNIKKDQKIMYQNGLEKQLWYRKSKGEKVQNKQSKLNDAINKQISKFVMFKQYNEKSKK